MYWMEFIIKLNENRNGGNLVLYDDFGNDLKEMEGVFDSIDEIICFATEMPKTLIETCDGKTISVEELK